MAMGQCNCGAVAFEVSASLTTVYVCHCSICRRATGSNAIAVVIVDNEQFRWQRGEQYINHWQKPDSDWHMWFCRQCGSPLPGRNDESRMFVPAGTIVEGGESLQVKHHIWVDSKAPWDEIGDAGRQHPQAFESG